MPRYRKNYKKKSYRNGLTKKESKQVAKIAKKVAIKLPELKRYRLTAIPQYIGNPSTDRCHVRCLADSSDIVQGDSAHQRIGNKIHIVGFNMRLQVEAPLLNIKWSRLIVRVVKFMGPLPPTITSSNTPDNIYISQQWLNLSENKQKLNVLFKKTFYFNSRDIKEEWDQSLTGVFSQLTPVKSYQVPVQKCIHYNKFVKVNQKQKYIGELTTDQQYSSNYYLMVHAYAEKQAEYDGGYWNNGNGGDTLKVNEKEYNPNIIYSIETLYRDC